MAGVHNLAVWQAVAATFLRMVGVHHEQVAVYPADGYARTTGRLGVAVVTTSRGAANTMGATGEAVACGSPVLVLTTDIPTTCRRAGDYRGVLHETRDQAAMFVPVTGSVTATAAACDVYDDVVTAASSALRPSSMPVYLGLPTDLLGSSADVPARQVVPPNRAKTPGRSAAPSGARDGCEPDLVGALRLIKAADRPLVWAGGGALRSGASDVVGELAERLTAPVINTYSASGLLPPGHPCLVPGPTHVPAVGRLWVEAALVIAVGTDFDGMMTQNWAMPAPRTLLAVNVDREDAYKNYRPDHALVGVATQVLTGLVGDVPLRNDLERLWSDLDTVGRHVRVIVLNEGPQAARMLDALDRRVPPNTVVVADRCVADYWLATLHRVPGPRQLFYSMGWGTLRHAFPASLGVAAVGAGRAIAVVRDGCFLYACGDLATAKQERLPITVVIVDDGGYEMLRHGQLHPGVAARAVDLCTPHCTELAHAFGIDATAVDGFGAVFETTLTDYVRSARPNVIVVQAAVTSPPSTSARCYRRRRGQQ